MSFLLRKRGSHKLDVKSEARDGQESISIEKASSSAAVFYVPPHHVYCGGEGLIQL